MTDKDDALASKIWSDTFVSHPYQSGDKWVPQKRALAAIKAALATPAQRMGQEALQLTDRIAEVVQEDGGCWSACSGCQESVDGYVSSRDYPYSPIFKCQPGGGCRECGGLGVIWQDGDFLSSYGDALSLPDAPPIDVLPCDVKLPPATTVRAGCTFDTLRLAMAMPDRPRHFNSSPGRVFEPYPGAFADILGPEGSGE